MGIEYCDPQTKRAATVLDDAKINSIGCAWTYYVREYLKKNQGRVRPDLVLISGNPFPCFDLAKDFSNSGSKVILDFRDPFAHNPRFTYSTEQKKVVTSLEDEYISQADAITSVNDQCLGLIGTDLRKPGLVISNGYDESQLPAFLSTPEVAVGSKIKFAYAGTLYDDCNPKGFVELLDPAHHEFLHMGRSQKVLESLRGLECLSELGFLPYKKVMEHLSRADVGLIFTGGKPFEHTTKIFDYIAVDIDILIVTEGTVQTGEIHALTENLERVFWVRNTHSDIRGFLQAYQRARPNRRQRVQYSRREQTKKLIQFMYSLLEQ